MTQSAVVPSPAFSIGRIDFLEENLRSLAMNSILSNRIRQATSRARIVRQSDGTPLVEICGRLVGAPLPAAEVRRAIAKANTTCAFVVMGLGVGHVPRALREGSGLPIIVYEPDAGVLKTVLEHGPADLGEFAIVTSPHELASAWAHLAGQFDGAVVVATPGYGEAYPAACAQLHRNVTELLQRVQVTRNTYRRRSKDWVTDVLENVEVLTESIPFLRLRGKYRDVPAFIVGAGPSLDKNIHLLREAQRKGIVICVNSSSRPLADQGVEPQVLACIESLDSSELLAQLPFIDRVVRAFSLTAAPGILRTGKGPMLPIYESLPQLNKPLAELTGVGGIPVCGSVSTVAFSLAEHLGCSPIVMLGQDLAYTTGRTHAEGTWWESSRATVSADTNEVQIEWSENLKKIGHRHEQEPVVETRAWGGEGTVFSGVSFSGIRAWFESAADMLGALRPEVTLINATEGGASIGGFAEVTLESVLATLPDREITAASIARDAAREATPVGVDRIVEWLENNRLLTSHARRAARRVRKLALMSTAAARRNDPRTVTRTFDKLSHAERALGEAVRQAPLLDAWCHADVDAVMAQHEAHENQDQQSSAVRATEQGANLASTIEHCARDLEREFQRIIARLKD